MGRLSGFNYRLIIKKLRIFGFEFLRYAAGSHELWYNHDTERIVTIARHRGDVPEGTLRAILSQAGIAIDDFLDAK